MAAGHVKQNGAPHMHLYGGVGGVTYQRWGHNSLIREDRYNFWLWDFCMDVLFNMTDDDIDLSMHGYTNRMAGNSFHLHLLPLDSKTQQPHYKAWRLNGLPSVIFETPNTRYRYLVGCGAFC